MFIVIVFVTLINLVFDSYYSAKLGVQKFVIDKRYKKENIITYYTILN